MFRPRILLVRHGETEDNKNLIFQGQGGKGLNAKGKEQAALVAARLAHAKIAAVFSSDLARAQETANAIAAPHAIAVTLETELREVDVGAWTGLPYAEVQARFPEEWASWRAGIDVRRGGGETYAELGERMMRALDRIEKATDGVAVCVSHGGSIRSVIQSVFGLAVSGHVLVAAENTGITLLERDDEHDDERDEIGGFRVAIYNDSNHLRDPVLVRLAELPPR